MNDLKARFNKSRLTIQQKTRIVEEVQQTKKQFNWLPVILPSFIALVLLLTWLTINSSALPTQTTAATSGQIISQNFYLNSCNVLLIIGNLLYILKLIKDGQWKMSPKLRVVVEKSYIFIIIGAIFFYSSIDAYVGMYSYYKEIMFMLLLLMLVMLAIFCPTDAVAGKGVIHFKWLLWLSSIGYAISFVMSLTIDPLNYLQATTTLFSFPLKIQGESYMYGTIGGTLFVMSLVGVFVSLKKYRALTLAILVLVPNAAPHIWSNVHQSLFAEGVEAIDYANDSYCEYDTVTEGIIDFRCTLTLHNKSSNPVTFELEFLDAQKFEDDKHFEWFNLAGPFTYQLKANEQKTLTIEDRIDMRQVEGELYSGSGTVNFILKDEQHEVVY